MGRVYFPTKNDIGVRTLSGAGLGADYASFRAPAEPAPRAASTLVTLGMVAYQSDGGTEQYGGSNSPFQAAVNAGIIPPSMLPAPVASAPQNNIIIRPTPLVYNPPPAPIATPIYSIGTPVAAPQPQPIITPVITQPAPAPAPVVAPAAPPVSQQTTPTPTVTVPAAPVTSAVLVTTGGGTASPNVAPAAAATPAPTIYTYDASGNIVNAQTGAIVVPAAQAASSGTTAASMNTAAAAAPAASSSVTDQIAAWLGGSTSIGSYAVPNALLAGIVILGFAWLEGGGTSGKKR